MEADKELREQLNVLIYEVTDSDDVVKQLADLLIPALIAWRDRAVVAELTPFTDLQGEIEATHFEPCNFCGQVSHHCNCASPLIWVEKTARERITELTKEEGA